jgi:hypothetical protein
MNFFLKVARLRFARVHLGVYCTNDVQAGLYAFFKALIGHRGRQFGLAQFAMTLAQRALYDFVVFGHGGFSSAGLRVVNAWCAVELVP